MYRISEVDIERAPCLRDSSISESGRNLVIASQNLGNTPMAGVLRAWCVPSLFGAMENIFNSSVEPVAAINEAMDKLTQFLKTGGELASNIIIEKNDDRLNESTNEKVELITGEHYGQLFKQFSDTSYWDEPAKLLRDRLERNGIPLSDIEGKSAIDVGCGGGRYTVALRLLGAGEVTGYDISATGLADAKKRVEASDIKNVSFQQGNVLSLPFEDNSFDIVYSNGVLHHTEDWEKGVSELVRILKPGGLGWLYLIENPGGLFWDLIEILRVVTKDLDKAAARNALRMIGVPANRIFYMLDHVMVPINVRLTPSEIESRLEKSGATQIRRLERGTDFDRVEQIYQKQPFAEVKYGVGENRFIFSK